MNTGRRSQASLLTGSEIKLGACSVCGRTVRIKYRDESTGFGIGDCCIFQLIRAESLLNAVEGLRHPTLEESRRMAQRKA